MGTATATAAPSDPVLLAPEARRQALEDSEAGLAAREAELAAREAELRDRERLVRERELELATREQRLQELEATERGYQALEAEAAVGRAADTPTAPATLARPRAEEEAAQKTQNAVRSLEAAEVAGGGEALGEARQLLEDPCAKSAASALMAIADVAKGCDKEALGAVKAAERAVRDVVVVRCRSRAEPGDRGAFLEAAEEAFGRPLDRELRAVLLLAYHKFAKNRPDTFLSNSQLATARRGRPRPRRRRAARADGTAAPEDGVGGDAAAPPAALSHDAAAPPPKARSPPRAARRSLCAEPCRGVAWKVGDIADLEPHFVPLPQCRFLDDLDGARDAQHLVAGERFSHLGPYAWITEPAQADFYMKMLWADVSDRPMVGVDVEYHFDQVCVVQLATDRLGLVLDALALQADVMRAILQPLLGDERVCKVFHGHCNDLCWLASNFDIVVSEPIFDTAVNAQQLCGTWEERPPSLQWLCRQYLNYELDKTYQTANWRQRPLPAEMLKYAAIDAQVLLPLQAAIDDAINATWGYDWEKSIL